MVLPSAEQRMSQILPVKCFFFFSFSPPSQAHVHVYSGKVLALQEQGLEFNPRNHNKKKGLGFVVHTWDARSLWRQVDFLGFLSSQPSLMANKDPVSKKR